MSAGGGGEGSGEIVGSAREVVRGLDGFFSIYFRLPSFTSADCGATPASTR